MTDKLDATLKKLAAGMPNGKKTSPDPDPDSASDSQNPKSAHDLPGDPNCPICGGVGYLRRDLPVGHPDFGKLEICTCRHSDINRQVRDRLFSLSHLKELGDMSFENFQPRGRIGLWAQQADSLERAYNQARQFAQTLNGWLLLMGGYGCGKTHLAAAIANFAVSMGVPTLFLTVPDLLDSLRFAYQDPEASFEERFEAVRGAPLLVLDDFGTQNATPWAQEKLFQILNYRYINRLPLVVTTNLDLRDIEERISSRLQDPNIVTVAEITATDFRRPVRDLGYSTLSSLDVLHERTFETFDLRKNEGLKAEELRSLENGLQAAREYAANPRGWLVFTGPYGCGKTHLAAAIGNYRQRQGQQVVFVVVPDLLDHLRATFNPSSTISLDRRFEEVRNADLLILDDLGTQSMTPWVKEKLYQLFNHRYNAEKLTLITTADYKNEVDPRLLSRMQDTRVCRTVVLTVPAYRGAAPKSRRSAGRRE